MRSITVFRSIALALLLLPSLVQGQQTGTAIYGLDLDQFAQCATVLPNGRTRIGGLTRSIQGSSSFSGYLVEESATTVGDLTMSAKYNQGIETFVFRSLSAHPTNGTMAAVATSRPGSQFDDDAVFMDMNSIGTVIHSRTWNSDGYEIPNRVKVLSDGSFVVVGRLIDVNNVRFSFISRLAAPSGGYAPVFHRVIGTPGNVGAVLDEAIAVDQYPDGRLLVMGMTHHYARSAEGSIYLAVLDLNGSILNFKCYQMENTVFAPRAKDMALMPDGSVMIVGNTTDFSGTGAFNGFVFKVAPDLLSGTFLEVSQPGQTTKSEEFVSVLPLPANGEVALGGNIERTVLGQTSFDGLIVRLDNVLNVMSTFAQNDNSPSADEFFMDLVLCGNGNQVEAIGYTDRSPGAGFSGLNLYTTKYNISSLSICFGSSVGLELTPKIVKRYTPNVQSTTTMTTVTGSIVRTSLVSNEFTGCHSLKTAPMQATPEESLETALFPNPAAGSVTLRIADLEGSANVQLVDLSGRVLRRLETGTAETELDLEGLASGMYLVHIVTGKERVTKKLQVQ